MEDSSYQTLIDKALKLLSYRPRTKKEISGRIMQLAIKKGIPAKLVDKAILDLEERKLIDDEEFVRWWINQRDTFRPKGIRLIKMELRHQGIDTETIESILEEKNHNTSHEFELALSLAQKKLSRLKSLPKEELRAKLTAFLGRRGFDFETIYDVIDSLYKKE